MDRTRAALVFIAVLAVGLGWCGLRSAGKARSEALERSVEGERTAAPAPPAAPAAPTLESLRASGDVAKLRSALLELLRRDVTDARYAEARPLYDELRKDHAQSSEGREALDVWAIGRSKQLHDAASTLDYAVLEQLIPDVLDDAAGRGESQLSEPRRRLCDHFLEQYRVAADSAGQIDALAKAESAVYTPQDLDPVVEALAQTRSRGELEALAEKAELKPAAALALWKAAWLKATRDREEGAADLQQKIDRLALRLVRDRRAGDFPWMSWFDARRTCLVVAEHALQAAQGSDDQRTAQAQRGIDAIAALAEVTQSQLRWLVDERSFEAAAEAAKSALGEGGKQLVQLHAALPHGDAFEGVSAAARAELEQIESDPQRRVGALQDRVQQGDVALSSSELDPVRKALGSLLGRWGLELMADRDAARRERGAALLRAVFRDHEGEAPAREAAEGLKAALDAASAAHDFDLLFDLAGVYVTEAAPAQRFAPEVKAHLVAAADHFGRSSRRGVFVLTLLADAFPDEPEGQAARRDATGVAFRLVEGVTPGDAKPRPLGLPSGLRGHSVYCAENSTAAHLLAFFDGPEQFFARFNPSRRGSVVVRDGSYRVAVLSVDEQVLPYTGQLKLGGQTLMSRYYVKPVAERDDGSSFLGRYAGAGGDWRLVRAPQGVEVVIDPRTCLARAARR